MISPVVSLANCIRTSAASSILRLPQAISRGRERRPGSLDLSREKALKPRGWRACRTAG